jgi:hypothetical protein
MQIRNLIDGGAYNILTGTLNVSGSEEDQLNQELEILTKCIIEKTSDITQEIQNEDYDKIRESIADIILLATGLASRVVTSGVEMENTIQEKIK